MAAQPHRLELNVACGEDDLRQRRYLKSVETDAGAGSALISSALSSYRRAETTRPSAGVPRRDTLDQYLTIANQHGFIKRRQLLDLLDHHPGRDALITWIRENGSGQWRQYLDSITVSQGAGAGQEDPI